MTVGDRLMEQGRQEGRREGRREGTAAALLKQLRLRFGIVPPEVAHQVGVADASLLDRWVERVLTAARVEDVFES